MVKGGASHSDSHYARRETPHFSVPRDGLIGRYEVRRKIGRGAFGTVFEAVSLRSGRVYALKVIKPVRKYVESAREEVVKLETLREIDPKGRRFVRLYRSFDLQKNFVMVFELLGISLHELIRRNGSRGLSAKVVAAIAREVLKGLQILHENRLVHTDLKVA